MEGRYAKQFFSQYRATAWESPEHRSFYPLYLPLLFVHRIILVGGLSFYPFLQTLWGLRNQPLYERILLAADDAIPLAFLAMLIGEAYAATLGLGFMMTIAGATNQVDKGLVGVFLVVALLMGLSYILRSIAKRLHSPEPSAEVVPAQAS